MRLLIIGNLYDNHNGRLISNLRKNKPDMNISFMYRQSPNKALANYSELLDNKYVIYRHFPSFFYLIPIFRAVIRMIDQKKCVKNMIESKISFDIVNVQYVSIYSLLASKLYHKLAKTVLLSPWGSDVYRVNKFLLPQIKKIYDRADYVSGGEGRFRDDFANIFKINKSRIVEFDIGSDTIDYIKDNNIHFTKEKSKEIIGLADLYVIVCGYNASPAQNHIIMIDAFCENLKDLPRNYILVFPMTYSGTDDYKESIRDLLEERKLRYKIYDSYLPMDNLFHLRRSADMFIHIQDTDANSAAVREYLLTDTKVLNGSWLRYKELEKDNIPYYIVSDFNSLKDDIKIALKQPCKTISPELRRQIEGYGWEKQIRLWIDFFELHS